MDAHKDTIAVAVTATGEVGKATAYGTFPNTAATLEKLVKRLRQAGNGPLKFCYEARPCGYGVHRTLTKLGEDYMVVAPSMIPRKSGGRQKNDKRDAASLAVLNRGGLLTAVGVPDAAHEAMRDLIRARLAAVRAVRAARQQLSAFLLRHERIYPDGRAAWTKAHRGWLADQHLLNWRSRSSRRRVSRRFVWANRGEIVLTAICARRYRPGHYSHWYRTCARCAAWTRSPVLAWRRRLAIRRALSRLHGLSRHGAIRTHLRPEAPHRRHHQGRRRSRSNPIDRSCPQLPPPGPLPSSGYSNGYAPSEPWPASPGTS
jgi:hypothetical protein